MNMKNKQSDRIGLYKLYIRARNSDIWQVTGSDTCPKTEGL
jgi:hypothetical protein